MQCPVCARKTYLLHRPRWARMLRWVRLFYCTNCKRRYVRLSGLDVG
jgi:uncharacterized protein YlaI